MHPHAPFAPPPRLLLPPPHSFDAINDKASYDAFKAYGQSKLANLLFARQLAENLKGKPVAVVACHPGGIDTELGRHIQVPALLRPVLKVMIRYDCNGPALLPCCPAALLPCCPAALLRCRHEK
jgi:NAD(P)-dependent dehydrogenase (short-subunit alcohol dehydrogenase family)